MLRTAYIVQYMQGLHQSRHCTVCPQCSGS